MSADRRREPPIHADGRGRICVYRRPSAVSLLCIGGFLVVAGLSAVQALEIPKPTYSLNFGANGEINGASDSTRLRKPPYLYTFALDGSLSWWVFSAGLNLLYNSDDKFTAQKVHRIDFSPSWKWGRIYLGDYAPALSEFTLSGVPLYGAGIELYPQSFRFAAVYGQSRRASSDSTAFAYRRTIYGGRIGTEWVSLIVLRAADDTLSNRMDDSVPVAPQENLVASLATDCQPAKDLSLVLEAAGSLHTRDLRSDTIWAKEIPIQVYQVFMPRWSTRADYALKGSIKYSPRPFSAGIEFAQVGPGYTSLGVSFLKNDYRYGKLLLGLRAIPKTEINLTGEMGWDNIVNDKLATTETRALGAAFRVAPVSQVNLAANYDLRSQNKNTASDSFNVNSLTQTLAVMPNFNVQFWGVSQSFNLMATYLDFRNRTPLSGTPPSRTLTLGLNYALTPKLPITFASGISRTINLSDSAQAVPEYYQNLSLTANKGFFNEKLQNSLTFSYQPSSLGQNLALYGTHAFSLTARDVFNLSWNLNYFITAQTGQSSFLGQRAALSFNRRVF